MTIFFIAAGGGKVMNPEKHAESFQRWGYPEWFVYFTGFVEVVGAGCLLLPRARIYGVSLLGITMIGATWTHFSAGEIPAVPIPSVLFLILSILGILSWKRLG